MRGLLQSGGAQVSVSLVDRRLRVKLAERYAGVEAEPGELVADPLIEG